jgi:hypothetical protein
VAIWGHSTVLSSQERTPKSQQTLWSDDRARTRTHSSSCYAAWNDQKSEDKREVKWGHLQPGPWLQAGCWQGDPQTGARNTSQPPLGQSSEKERPLPGAQSLLLLVVSSSLGRRGSNLGTDSILPLSPRIPLGDTLKISPNNGFLFFAGRQDHCGDKKEETQPAWRPGGLLASQKRSR